MDFFFFLSLLLITFFIFSFFQSFSIVFVLCFVFFCFWVLLILWGPRLCGEMPRYQNTTKRPRALLLASIDSIFFLFKVATYSFELAMLLLLQNQQNLLMLICVCVCLFAVLEKLTGLIGKWEPKNHQPMETIAVPAFHCSAVTCQCQMHLQKIPARAVKTDAEGATLTKPYFFFDGTSNFASQAPKEQIPVAFRAQRQPQTEHE